MLMIADLQYLETCTVDSEIVGGFSRTIVAMAQVTVAGNIFGVGRTTAIAITGAGSFRR